MKHTYLFILIAFLFSTSLFSQKVLTTNSGQRILLVDDGSWRLIHETENLEGSASESGTSLESFKSPKQGKYPINSDQREDIQNLLTNFLSDEAQLLVNIEMSKRKLNQLKKEKSKSKKDKTEEEKIKYQIAQTKTTLKQDEKYYKSTSNLISISNELLDGKVKNKEKAIASLEMGYNTSETINTGMGGVASESEPEEELVIAEPEIMTKKYPTTFSIENNRGTISDLDCEIIFDGFDNDMGVERKEVKTQSFFGFSQEKMKPYLKTEDYLTCDANVSKIDNNYYITLRIRIRSKDASKSYGTLKANENIKIQMINGRSVYGKNMNNDPGKVESYTGNTLYTGIFQISKGDMNDLKNNYVDNVGIIWSSGYEQYDIFNVDFLTNQIKCLNK